MTKRPISHKSDAQPSPIKAGTSEIVTGISPYKVSPDDIINTYYLKKSFWRPWKPAKIVRRRAKILDACRVAFQGYRYYAEILPEEAINEKAPVEDRDSNGRGRG